MIHREQLGHLSVGAIADIADPANGKRPFRVCRLVGCAHGWHQRLVGELTVASGRVVYDLNGLTRDRWDRLGKYQAQGDPVWDGTRGAARPRPLPPLN